MLASHAERSLLLIAACCMGLCAPGIAWAAAAGPSSPGISLRELGQQGGPDAGGAGEDGGAAQSIQEAFLDGRLHVDLRLRYEYADIDGSDAGHASTGRLRLGYGTKPLAGFSGYFEFEGVGAVDEDAYNSSIGGDPAKSIIADPAVAELNQAFGKYEGFGFTVIGGRQRIIFDDSRFVGNVGWRQDEQTFDGGLVEYRADEDGPLDGLTITYAYLAQINRIVANERDWDSDSHLVNVGYDGLGFGKFVAFAYLLDFRTDAPGAQSNTAGFRFSGSAPLSDGVGTADFADDADWEGRVASAHAMPMGAARLSCWNGARGFGGGRVWMRVARRIRSLTVAARFDSLRHF